MQSSSHVAQLLYYFVARTAKLVYLLRSFGRLFWGEQPPFTPLGCGGRYLFGDKKKTPSIQRSKPVSRPCRDWHGHEITLPSLERLGYCHSIQASKIAQRFNAGLR